MSTDLPPHLTRLPVACSAALAGALGFARATRHVAVFRSHITGEAMWMDAQRMGRANEGPLRSLLAHPPIRDRVAGLNLGSRGSEAEHWLLADRVAEVIVVGEVAEVAPFVRPLGAADGASSRWTTALEEMRAAVAAQAGDASEAQRAVDAVEEDARQRMLTERLTALLDGPAPPRP